MDWNTLLNANRPRQTTSPGDHREEFERDYDRSVFSSPVKRLQDKAQVFPLEPHDSVRTRLTHSLEVSSVAKGLARKVCKEVLVGKLSIEQDRQIEAIAATCGLLHDLGNPPFGHSGEDAIREWFKNMGVQKLRALLDDREELVQDFIQFEGNAQTLRIVSKLQILADFKGLNLTYGTLSALCKYTASSAESVQFQVNEKQLEQFKDSKGIDSREYKDAKTRLDHSKSKPGYFASEAGLISEIRETTGTVIAGPEIAPDQPGAERADYSQVVLEGRLRQALERLNPQVPVDAIEEAFRKLTHPDAPSLVAANRIIHKYLVDGVPVEFQRPDGSLGGDLVRVIDYDDIDNNEFLAVNQFTVVEDRHERRPDIVLFVNGLPLAVLELKNATNESATIWSAFNQLQTYKEQIPSLFAFNEALVISDGVQARIGTISSDRERFAPWRTIEGETLADATMPQLQVMLEGVFEKRRFLDLVRYFNVFEDVGGGVLIKMLAGYHQFHAVNTALEETVRACALQDAAKVAEDHGNYFAKQQSRGAVGDRRVGVVWHTQGSGKSLTMAFYAGRVVLHPEMQNPTLVIITDRNDLDDQLFSTFAKCHELLRQQPIQATNRANLRELLQTGSGGVIFTTIHKFFPTSGEDQHPLLSDRRNIVVIADEAHRSQYDFIDGFARHMREALPNASFIGFTGTPIELADANTRSVFGDYISVYDIERAVKDGATVPIYYESRLANLSLEPEERPKLDADFEEATEGEEIDHKEKLKTKWAALEALVGAEKRVALIAEDMVNHFERRLEAMDGKAMVVCMSRRICVDVYNAIIKLRPDWHHDDDDKGILKVIMTGSAADPPDWQPHVRSKSRREELAKRFKDAKDPFKVVIVRDMWLTGFDAPCLHTMYADKPMRGHGLMQAIARVNRVFKDKPGGLIVDYLGLAHELKQALATYTDSGGSGRAAVDQEEAVAVMQEKYEVFHYGKYKRADLIEAARRSRACAYLADDDHGPLALQEILLAGCPTIGVRTGAPFLEDGITGYLVNKLPSGQHFHRDDADLCALQYLLKTLEQALQLNRDSVFRASYHKMKPESIVNRLIDALNCTRRRNRQAQ